MSTAPRKKGRPVVLGLMGDSGSGKATLSGGIVHLLGSERVSDLCLDDYHKYDRAERSRRAITAIHPDCNHLDLIRQHLELLRRGETVFKPVYDHSIGTFGKPEFLTPREFIVAHGLLGFHTEALRACYDLAVFVDPDPELRIQWKLQRDTTRRGYAPIQVRRQLEHRRADSERFIRPQCEKADVVISFFPPAAARPVSDSGKLSVRLMLRRAPGGPDVATLFAEAAARGGESSRSPVRMVNEGARECSTVLEIDGAISDELAGAIARELQRTLPPPQQARIDTLGTFLEENAVRHSHTLALTQLLVTTLLPHTSEESREREPSSILTV